MHGLSDNDTVSDFRDPFYASVSPQVYALAVATAISYVLVIMLFITPRTFFVGGPGGGAGFLSRRGLIGGSYGHSAVIGVGRRPWLQKIATLSAAVSLTVATADTFKVAERQYEAGFSDSGAVVNEVTTSLEIRIVQVISDTFLWLAQVQTLIRLFPRHKEKVVIKWLGFGLIMLDTLFSTLNNFVYEAARTRPRTFRDAIPALSYLFELAIGFIYASCIIYFSISKRRFAFFHPKMRNIFIVALMSISAVLIPIVFFVLDVSKPNVAGWGDYIRWVGAAAASVVVWEWVERIEALERDERKDGILGRELFEGDEMLNITPSEDNSNRRDRGLDGDGVRGKTSSSNLGRRLRPRMSFRGRRSPHSDTGLQHPPPIATTLANLVTSRPTPPPAGITPVSRADTTSATSTQYAIHYHTVASPSPPPAQGLEISSTENSRPSGSDPPSSSADTEKHDSAVKEQPRVTFAQNVLRTVPNPFKRQRTSPPAEVADAMRVHLEEPRPTSTSNEDRPGWQFIAKVDAFAISQRKRLMSRFQGHSSDTILPVTVIPAQPRGHRTWSPQDFDGLAQQQGTSSERVVTSTTSNPLVTMDESRVRHGTVEGPAVLGGQSNRASSNGQDLRDPSPASTHDANASGLPSSMPSNGVPMEDRPHAVSIPSKPEDTSNRSPLGAMPNLSDVTDSVSIPPISNPHGNIAEQCNPTGMSSRPPKEQPNSAD